MAVHTHSKVLSPMERYDASTIRLELNSAIDRLHGSYHRFHMNHNSGYCAFEMAKAVTKMQQNLDTIKGLLNDLGGLEHYNYEAVLAEEEA